MRIISPVLIGVLSLGLLTSCMSDKQFKEKLEKVMKEDSSEGGDDKVFQERMRRALKNDPTILTDAIKNSPVDFVEAMQDAFTEAKDEIQKKKAVEEQERRKNEIAKYIKDPLEPEIRKDEAIRGSKSAPITLIEYSDFECPFCKRGYDTVNELLSKYKGKIRFVYKHLPLSFHPNAEPAARYFEAMRLQSDEKAFKFHDLIFENQPQLKKGEPFLKKMAKEAGADMAKLAKDVQSEALKKRVQDDAKEAAKFGIQGTPGFVINGVPVKGAYPSSHFDMIIEKMKEAGALKL